MTPEIGLYYTTSLDGFIADHNQNCEWARDSWQRYLETCLAAGHLIMGRNTYELFLLDPTINSLPFRSICILSSSLTSVDSRHTLVRTPAQAFHHLRTTRAKQALLIGGARTAASFLNAELLNYLQLEIHPVILGKGIPLFDTSEKPVELSLLSMIARENNVVSVRYSVGKR